MVPNMLAPGETLESVVRRDEIAAVEVGFLCDLCGDDGTFFVQCVPERAEIIAVCGKPLRGQSTIIHDTPVDGDMSEVGQVVADLLRAILTVHGGEAA